VDNAYNFRLIQQSQESFKKLYEVGTALGAITDPKEIEKAYELAVRAVSRDKQVNAFLHKLDPQSQTLVLVWRSESSPTKLPESIALDDKGIDATVAREKKAVDLPDTTQPENGVSLNRFDRIYGSRIAVPLGFGGNNYGVLSIGHPEPHSFSDIDLKFIEGVSQLLALTIYRLAAEKNARELEAIGLMGHVAYELAHRIGNDLGWVQVTFDTTLPASLSPYLKRKLEKLIVNVFKVLKLGNDVKSALMTGGSHKKMITVEECVSQIRDRVSSVPDRIRFEWEIESIDSFLYADVAQIASIVQNLISNAVDALPGRGKIEIRIWEVGDWIGIKVSDDGVGIPEEIRERIYDLFISSKGSSGFGLWSARQHTLMHEGSLTCESAIGKGTAFTLLLRKAESYEAPIEGLAA
jgi:signal transduction histidine kinase